MNGERTDVINSPKARSRPKPPPNGDEMASDDSRVGYRPRIGIGDSRTIGFNEISSNERRPRSGRRPSPGPKLPPTTTTQSRRPRTVFASPTTSNRHRLGPNNRIYQPFGKMTASPQPKTPVHDTHARSKAIPAAARHHVTMDASNIAFRLFFCLAIKPDLTGITKEPSTTMWPGGTSPVRARLAWQSPHPTPIISIRARPRRRNYKRGLISEFCLHKSSNFCCRQKCSSDPGGKLQSSCLNRAIK